MSNKENSKVIIPINPELKVDGFDPEKYKQYYPDGVPYLPFKIQLAWFRMKYPNGKLLMYRPAWSDAKEVNTYAATARVYKDSNDPQDAFLAEASAQRGPDTKIVETGEPISPYNMSQVAAMSLALKLAGFWCGLTEDDLTRELELEYANGAKPIAEQEAAEESKSEETAENTDNVDTTVTQEPAAEVDKKDEKSGKRGGRKKAEATKNTAEKSDVQESASETQEPEQKEAEQEKAADEQPVNEQPAETPIEAVVEQATEEQAPEQVAEEQTEQNDSTEEKTEEAASENAEDAEEKAEEAPEEKTEEQAEEDAPAEDVPETSTDAVADDKAEAETEALVEESADTSEAPAPEADVSEEKTEETAEEAAEETADEPVDEELLAELRAVEFRNNYFQGTLGELEKEKEAGNDLLKETTYYLLRQSDICKRKYAKESAAMLQLCNLIHKEWITEAKQAANNAG